MDQIDFGSQLGQIKGFFQRSIAAADDGDRRIAEEVAVAQGAIRDPMTDEGILASAGELFKGCHSALGYVPEWQIDIYLRYIVPNVMKKHRMDEIIQVARV